MALADVAGPEEHVAVLCAPCSAVSHGVLTGGQPVSRLPPPVPDTKAPAPSSPWSRLQPWGRPFLPARRALTLLWLDQSHRTALSGLPTRCMEAAAICSKWPAQSRQPKKKRT